MKIRQVLDRLDEISRRDFLKGAGAAAVGSLTSKVSKADWSDIYDKDLLTNKFEMSQSVNFSEEDSHVILVFMPKTEYFSIKMPINRIPAQILNNLVWNKHSVGDATVRSEYSFRILLGNSAQNKIIGPATNPVFADLNANELIFLLVSQDTARFLNSRGIGKNELDALITNKLVGDNLKIEISIGKFKQVYTFLGKKGPNLYKDDSLNNRSENNKPSSNQQRSNIKDI